MPPALRCRRIAKEVQLEDVNMTSFKTRMQHLFFAGLVMLANATVILASSPAHAQAQAPAPAAAAPEAAPAAAAPAATAPKAPEAAPQTEVVKNPYGLDALWRQGDFVARGTLVVLVIMSIGSWYIGVLKLL